MLVLLKGRHRFNKVKCLLLSSDFLSTDELLSSVLVSLKEEFCFIQVLSTTITQNKLRIDVKLGKKVGEAETLIEFN